MNELPEHTDVYQKPIICLDTEFLRKYVVRLVLERSKVGNTAVNYEADHDSSKYVLANHALTFHGVSPFYFFIKVRAV